MVERIRILARLNRDVDDLKRRGDDPMVRTVDRPCRLHLSAGNENGSKPDPAGNVIVSDPLAT